WRMLGSLVAEKGHVVIRMGGRGIAPAEMMTKLKASSQFARRPIRMLYQNSSELKGRQTDAFRPGTRGCLAELDCHFQFKSRSLTFLMLRPACAEKTLARGTGRDLVQLLNLPARAKRVRPLSEGRPR